MTTAVQPETDGRLLAAAYDRAMRNYVESASSTSMAAEDADRWLWKQHLLLLASTDAMDDLYLHIKAYGPVETITGIYKLDGDGRLTFRRVDRGPHGG